MNNMTLARTIFIGFFILLMIGVVLLPGDYVFRGAPTRSRWRDLRFWAFLLVVIHIYVYWAF